LNDIIEKFNELTDDNFDYLKISAVNVDIDKRDTELVVIYPENKKQEILENKKKIEESLIKACKLKSNIKIKFTLSHIDSNFLIYDVLNFLTKYPSISHSITNRNIEYVENDNKKIIIITMPKAVLDYYFGMKLDKQLALHLDNSYCEKVNTQYVEGKDIEPEIQNIEETHYSFDYDGGRVIKVQNVDAIWGGHIYKPANYIVDTKPAKETVLCGKISQLKTYTYVPKKSENKKERQYCKFNLVDPTGEIQCIVFPPSKAAEKLSFLIEGKEIIALGEVELNSFKDTQSLVFKPKAICFCMLPSDFKINRIKCEVNNEYHTVFPYPYVDYTQENLFDIDEEVPQFLMKKTFCVYDIETTGLLPSVHKIIEISAVKIVDGKITECFTSLVDPQCLIPEKITELTGISNNDVQNAPLISEVMPDFYKFTYSSIMVGQNNIAFDFPFISAKAKEMNIYFENEQLDTMILAKKYMPELSRFNLNKLSTKMGIINENSHRALSDAITTAKVFINLAKFIKN